MKHPSIILQYTRHKQMCVCWEIVLIHVHCTLYCYYYTHMVMGKILRRSIARPGHHLFCRQTDRHQLTSWMCLHARFQFLHLTSSSQFLPFSFLFVEISIYTQQRAERKKEQIKRRKKGTMAIDLHHGRGEWTRRKVPAEPMGRHTCGGTYARGDQQQQVGGRLHSRRAPTRTAGTAWW
jgi:hypothetical protein